MLPDCLCLGNCTLFRIQGHSLWGPKAEATGFLAKCFLSKPAFYEYPFPRTRAPLTRPSSSGIRGITRHNCHCGATCPTNPRGFPPLEQNQQTHVAVQKKAASLPRNHRPQPAWVLVVPSIAIAASSGTCSNVDGMSCYA